jgi:hypothetical protein
VFGIPREELTTEAATRLYVERFGCHHGNRIVG